MTREMTQRWLRLGSAACILLMSVVYSPGGMAQAVAPVGINRSVLKPGSAGDDVQELQAALKLLGFHTGAVDGIYGDGTAIAVTRFQKAAGLNPDGIVGAVTWSRLFPPAPPTSPSASAANATVKPTATTKPAASSKPTPAATKPSPATSSKPASPSTVKKPPTPSPTQVATNPQSTIAEFPILRPGMRGPAVEGLQERLKAKGFFQGVVDSVFGPETSNAVKAAQRNYSLNPDGIVGPSTWLTIMR